MVRDNQMKDLLLSFHLVYWTTHRTILRPHTDHERKHNGMKPPAILLHWHPYDPSVLHGNASNCHHTIRICPLPSKEWIRMLSATGANHGRSFNRLLHTIPPASRAKITVHQRLKPFNNANTPIRPPIKAPNTSPLPFERALPGGREEWPPGLINNAIITRDECCPEIRTSSSLLSDE